MMDRLTATPETDLAEDEDFTQEEEEDGDTAGENRRHEPGTNWNEKQEHWTVVFCTEQAT